MISVCIASYNGEKYIREQLESILAQLENEDEVIVSDDGSTDTTLKIISDIQDSRIKVINNELEHGYTKNFENALNYCKGEYIFLADQDDVWCPDKVKKCIQALQSKPFVVHDAIMVNSDLEVFDTSQFKRYNVKPGFIHTFIRNRYNGCCMAFTRDFLENALPFPKNQHLCRQDYWLPYLAEFHHDSITLFEGLIWYRRHEGTTLNAGEKSSRSFYEKVVSRFYVLFEVLKRKYTVCPKENVN